MKRAVLLHGTDGSTNDLWWPWVKAKLNNLGYEYFAPSLPENHTPNRVKYANYLKTVDWDYKDNVLIGHSSGATTILNLLCEDWFPTVKTVVLFGAFLNENLVRSAEWYEPGQFDNLFLPEYSANKIAHKASSFYFLHGDNDP